MHGEISNVFGRGAGAHFEAAPQVQNLPATLRAKKNRGGFCFDGWDLGAAPKISAPHTFNRPSHPQSVPMHTSSVPGRFRVGNFSDFQTSRQISSRPRPLFVLGAAKTGASAHFECAPADAKPAAPLLNRQSTLKVCAREKKICRHPDTETLHPVFLVNFRNFREIFSLAGYKAEISTVGAHFERVTQVESGRAHALKVRGRLKLCGRKLSTWKTDRNRPETRESVGRAAHLRDRLWGEGVSPALYPRVRRGDGREAEFGHRPGQSAPIVGAGGTQPAQGVVIKSG